MIDEISKTREIAGRVLANTLDSAFVPASDIWNTLLSIPWKDLCSGCFSQQEMAAMNLELDPRSCLGRIALMLALIERYFPELLSQVRCAEVRSDLFRWMMLQQWGHPFSETSPPPDDWLDELLMYEEPHAIITIDGKQFDPLFCVYAEAADCPADSLAHPAVQEFSPWEATTAFRKVSEALLQANAAETIKKLREADSCCHGTCLVKQNLVGPLLLLGGDGSIEEAHRLVLELCNTAPGVRALIYLREFFAQTHPAADAYDPYLFALLKTAIGRSLS